MKKNTVFCMILAAALAVPAFSQIKIEFTPPEYEGSGIFSPGGAAGTVVPELNNALKDVFDGGFFDDINEQLDMIAHPDKFVKAFGTSSVFSSHGATMRGYAGYNNWFFSTGAMVGIQTPDKPWEILDMMDNISDDMLHGDGIQLGFNPQVLNFQFGMKSPKFLPLSDKWYLGAQIGFFRLPPIADGLDFSSFNIGLRANYQLIGGFRLPLGVLEWRGINLGSGMIFQNTKLDFAMAMEGVGDLTGSTSGVTGGQAQITMSDPRIGLGLKVNTFTIPLEASTAIKVLFLNVTAGVGVDLGFGASTLTAGLYIDDISIDVSDVISGNSGAGLGDIYEATPGSASIDLENKQHPRFFNFKFMTGIGFMLGPVIIDIPINWYVPDGVTAGLTVGFKL